MEAIILTSEQYQKILEQLTSISQKVDKSEKPSPASFIDNHDFIMMMKISKRTAQSWRDEGKIAFSQIGNKIYYKVSDVETLIQKHYIKATDKK